MSTGGGIHHEAEAQWATISRETQAKHRRRIERRRRRTASWLGRTRATWRMASPGAGAEGSSS